jgi:methionyl-tRNA formyltransferase
MHAVHACRLGGLGVHPSLLPRHRGPDPYFAAIDAGDSVTGVTVHRLDAEYDTGAILAQHTLAIDPSWNAWQLARALDRPSLLALRETVARAAQGDQLVGRVQDESLATTAPEPDENDLALDWNQPTARIVRRIRALAPCPGAETCVGDVVLRVTEAVNAVSAPPALYVGEAAILNDVAVVRTADGAIALQRGEAGGQQLDASGIAMLVARCARK